MEIVYALDETPEVLTHSVFLAGPTPRSESVSSWRPAMLEQLSKLGFSGTVFVPEPEDGEWSGDYVEQAGWERTHLDLCDVIVAWIPRDMENMPALTTNVEFGRYVTSRKIIYGRPQNAPHTKYLDWLYDEECGLKPAVSLEEIAESVVRECKERQYRRTGGERCIPARIWESEMFQQWYQSHRQSGNRLDGARVLWSFFPKPDFLLSYILRVNVYVAKEDRNKSNEYIFSRKNISTVLPVWKNPDTDSILDTKIVLVREFRSPVQSHDSFVRELPSGSEIDQTGNKALEVAANELQQETGLEIPKERLARISSRQICATLSTHRSYLYIASLIDEEIQQAEELARSGKCFGESGSSEQTYVEVKTLGELLKSSEIDYTTLGMIMDGVAWLTGVGK
ncbi:MAG: nucleoside 2-deoxyribosyltransferase domain-containing protein [Verrucomicrobiales bacterium]|nr:nucleoside 2-deoxyribosyltransferase domain-containing protein [Verrucomicrobiales bacterium]